MTSWVSLAGAQISPGYGKVYLISLSYGGALNVGNVFECVVTNCLERDPRQMGVASASELALALALAIALCQGHFSLAGCLRRR